MGNIFRCFGSETFSNSRIEETSVEKDAGANTTVVCVYSLNWYFAGEN